MQLPTSLAVLAFAVSLNAQAFGGGPAGGASPGKALSFPGCAKNCINPPKGNFFNEISAFCSAVRTKDCCIINACPQGDKELAHKLSQRICDYVNTQIAPFTCALTSKATADATPTLQRGPDPGKSRHAPSGSGSIAHGNPSAHRSSIPSTLRTSIHSGRPSATDKSLRSSTDSTPRLSIRPSAHSLALPTGTPTLVETAPNSLPNSTKGSPTSTGPPSAHSTVSVYNGFAGAYCYTEGTSGRALTGSSTSSSSMTIETCIDFCEKTGWGWAGLENSNACYCGSGIVNGGARTDDSACDLGCAGNQSQNCGGATALSVYQSG